MCIRGRRKKCQTLMRPVRKDNVIGMRLITERQIAFIALIKLLKNNKITTQEYKIRLLALEDTKQKTKQ